VKTEMKLIAITHVIKGLVKLSTPKLCHPASTKSSIKTRWQLTVTLQ